MLFYLWLWGLGASTINVIKSVRAKNYLQKYDPDFVKYMDEKSDKEKALHNAKAIIKMLIPIYNIYHPIKLLFDRSYELAAIWRSKVIEKDQKKEKKAEKLSKLFPQAEKEKVQKEVKKEEPKQEVKKEIKKEPVVTKQPVKQFKDKYEILSDYCDNLNNSNTDYRVIMDFYSTEYKKAKIDYLEAKKVNDQAKMVDAYKRMKIVSDKSVELNQNKKNCVSHKLK